MTQRIIRYADFVHVKVWDTAKLNTTGGQWPKKDIERYLEASPTAASN